MPSRKIRFVTGEYYHLCNRGLDGRTIVATPKEYARLLFLLIFFQSSLSHGNLSRRVQSFMKTGRFLNGLEEKFIASKRTVSLVCFCIMNNHFHMLVREETDGGIPFYLQRIENAYTRYFNLNHGRNGHLFQGPFRAVHIETNDQLLYTSAYIHRNPRELKNFKNKEQSYQWSSLPDYLSTNRWPYLLSRELILGQFENPKEYQNYIDSSIAKLYPEELEKLNLFNLGG